MENPAITELRKRLDDLEKRFDIHAAPPYEPPAQAPKGKKS